MFCSTLNGSWFVYFLVPVGTLSSRKIQVTVLSKKTSYGINEHVAES